MISMARGGGLRSDTRDRRRPILRVTATVVLVLTACEPGRAPARQALDGYRRAVAETCACRVPACVAAAETSWLEVGREADRAHARFSGNEDIWLVQLELQYQQCRARALGHRGDYDQLGITGGK